jgi:hypothetical protein
MRQRRGGHNAIEPPGREADRCQTWSRTHRESGECVQGADEVAEQAQLVEELAREAQEDVTQLVDLVLGDDDELGRCSIPRIVSHMRTANTRRDARVLA